MAGPIRKRRFPIIGDGGGVWSHIHIEDAATATAIAVERGAPGVYYSSTTSPHVCGTGCRACGRARCDAAEACPAMAGPVGRG